MGDKLIEKLSKETFKNILYMAFIACFWVVSFYLFKPSLLEKSSILLGSLLFCLSFMYSILSLILLLLFEKLLFKAKLISELLLIRIEIYLLLSLIIKSAVICIGYYYSILFTTYLQIIFIGGAGVAVLFCLLVAKPHIRKRIPR